MKGCGRRLAILLLASFALTSCASASAGSAPDVVPAPAAATTTATPVGHEVLPAPLPDLVLTDTRGHRLDLRAAATGRVTLLYFGYTSCPDLCPTTMADVALALRRLPAGMRSDVRVVFVTTDPARDSPSTLLHWLARFDPSFIGLTGDPEAVMGAQLKAMGLPAGPVEAGPAVIGHPSGVIAYDRSGAQRLTFSPVTSPAQFARVLQTLLAA
jgi:protein SCO1/2